MMRIAVLTGGTTPERDVALAGAAQVVAALRARGHDVVVVDTVSGVLDREQERALLRPAVGREPPSAAELTRLAEQELGVALVRVPEVLDAEALFLVLHGREGEGGEMQTLLESAGLPYAGSGPLGSALAMDKDLAKRLCRDAGIPTPPWVMWPVAGEAVADLGLPVVVKPSKVGSTVGLTVVHRHADLGAAVETALRYDDEVLLEQYLPGREFTVGVLGDRALAVGEIIPSHDIFDYECKYTPGMTQEIFPADLDPGTTARMQDLALRVHRTLKLRDFSRVDFRLDAHGAPQYMEVNTLPGLTAASLLPKSAAAAGTPFEDLCEEICRMVVQRADRRNKAAGPGM